MTYYIYTNTSSFSPRNPNTIYSATVSMVKVIDDIRPEVNQRFGLCDWVVAI
jgi:hypothetical protein